MDWILLVSAALFILGGIILAEHARRALNASLKERAELLKLIKDLREDRTVLQGISHRLKNDAIRRVEEHGEGLKAQIVALERENLALATAISKIPVLNPVVYAPNLEKSRSDGANPSLLSLEDLVDEQEQPKIASWSDVTALKRKEMPE